MHTAGPQLTENIVSLLALSFVGLFAIFFWAIWLTCVELPKFIRWLKGYR